MPAPRPPSRPSRPAARPTESAVSDPVNDAQRDALQDGLEQLPTPLEPLDVSALDGFLCGVLLQPQALPESRWLPHVFDVEGRALPAGLDVSALRTLVLRRHRELMQAVAARQWFDPWVFELDDDDDEVEAVYPWVAGFATALTLFPALSDLAAGPQAPALVEPLALVYRHLDPDDLEDAEELLAEIDTLEPPANLSDAVEGLVRATLLMADVIQPQPQPKPAGGARPAPGRPRPSSKGPRSTRR
ncbi:MAG: YecA family protein [Pseudomonadota bacterium]